MIRFAHPAEAQLAELLDSFGVAWEYEPRTFILEFGSDGRPREGFTPDFYLPGFDLDVEITTLRQGLLGPKRRKIRRLNQTHPAVRVHLLDRRASHELVARFYFTDLAGATTRTLP